MKPAPINDRALSWRTLARLLACLAVLSFVAGCATSRSTPETSYRPSNVYRKNAYLPRDLKRVAVLPLAAAPSTEPLGDGTEALDPILQAELGKSERFEVVPVTSEQLEQWTGHLSWRAGDALPANFFSQLKAQTGCDAVLFCELTRYNAHQPVAIGWKFSLVEAAADSPNPTVIWCVDGIIDAGDKDAAKAAGTYQSQHLANEWRTSTQSMILSSPRRFGQFTLCAVFGTLPERKNR